MKKIRPYGTWLSPISAEDLAGSCIRLSEPCIREGMIYWLEGRPAEGGRYVICSMSHAGQNDISSDGFDVRTRVHEYGGGAWSIEEGILCFSNDSDHRVYISQMDAEPKVLTPQNECHYADFEVDQLRNCVYCVREDHSAPKQPINAIVSLDWRAGEDAGRILVGGADFYSSPRLSPDGTRLAWLQWNHPDMPWDSSELYVAELDADGNIDKVGCVAGGEGESIAHPCWSPDGILYFVSDRTNWWNIYRSTEAGVEAVTRLEAEFALPHWQFRMSCYDFVSADTIVCTYTQNGVWYLAEVNLQTLELKTLELPFTSYGHIQAEGNKVVFKAGSPYLPEAVILLDLDSLQFEFIKKSTEMTLDEEMLSPPKSITFASEKGRPSYGLFYAPKNGRFRGLDNEKPPLVVMVHSGPTSSASSSLNLKTQYFTSRGIAVFDVNYGGSTGYGRKYRELLNGQWGIVDVEDCCLGAEYLAAKGHVDPERMAISGGSAGGYTVLSALTFKNIFTAGVSRYGVSDCSAMARDTHKFEAHYLDRLIAPYPAREDIYRERSPLNHCDKLNCPVIFFQGLEDKVVPPDQAVAMYEALAARGIPTAYIAYEGEQHGFRKRENILRTITGELYFLSRIFNFNPADDLEPLEIINLED